MGLDYSLRRDGVGCLLSCNPIPNRFGAIGFVVKNMTERTRMDRTGSAGVDNLNTHTILSLYETFTPEHALALAERLEIHYTPKHGSWLNIAEIELSVLTIQCLNHLLKFMC
ncbi:hypothetical protein BSK58_04720 [Paenibacillus odorifer]|nr:hypothetical protein BSK58_04720 [Paenibacillus odorifer]